jgi:hypothetical protein
MKMAGYTKLFQSLLTSTIWQEDDKTRITWITMLALADQAGKVEASVPGLAHAANINLEACQRALTRLIAPDEYSRTKSHDGRRIRPVDGGWQILNYAKYREKCRSQDRRSYMRDAKRRQRARNGDNECQPMSTNVNHFQPIAEAEATTDKEGDIPIRPFLKEVEDAASRVGITEQDARQFFNHYNSQGWRLGNGRPITNLNSALMRWKNNPNKPRPPADEDQGPGTVRLADGRTPRQAALDRIERQRHGRRKPAKDVAAP